MMVIQLITLLIVMAMMFFAVNCLNMGKCKMSDFEITECMILNGGTFVSRLGMLFRVADSENREKLKLAFSEYFQNYEKFAKMRIISDLQES